MLNLIRMLVILQMDSFQEVDLGIEDMELGRLEIDHLLDLEVLLIRVLVL